MIKNYFPSFSARHPVCFGNEKTNIENFGNEETEIRKEKSGMWSPEIITHFIVDITTFLMTGFKNKNLWRVIFKSIKKTLIQCPKRPTTF